MIRPLIVVVLPVLCLHFSLGMVHGGQIGCSTFGYLMYPQPVPLNRLKDVSTVFTFSPCSWKQAKAVVEGTNHEGYKLVSYSGKECVLKELTPPLKYW